jgi:hypothetical protein
MPDEPAQSATVLDRVESLQRESIAALRESSEALGGFTTRAPVLERLVTIEEVRLAEAKRANDIADRAAVAAAAAADRAAVSAARVHAEDVSIATVRWTAIQSSVANLANSKAMERAVWAALLIGSTLLARYGIHVPAASDPEPPSMPIQEVHGVPTP